jgi:hypothetical protein
MGRRVDLEQLTLDWISDPQLTGTERHRVRVGARERDCLGHALAGWVDPGDGGADCARDPDRAVAAGDASRLIANRDPVHLPARFRVDARDRLPTGICHPHRAAGRRDRPRRPGEGCGRREPARGKAHSDNAARSLSLVDTAHCNGDDTSDCASQTPPQTPTRRSPIPALVDPATGILYVGSYDNADISVIDTAKCNAATIAGCPAIPRQIVVGSGPTSLALDPSSRTIYVPGFNDGTVSFVPMPRIALNGSR